MTRIRARMIGIPTIQIKARNQLQNWNSMQPQTGITNYQVSMQPQIY